MAGHYSYYITPGPTPTQNKPDPEKQGPLSGETKRLVEVHPETVEAFFKRGGAKVEAREGQAAE